jgi:hypothetical protein
MRTENIFIAHPTNAEQINALKAIVKAFKIKFEVTTKKEDDSVFISEMQSSLNQVQEMKEGKIAKQSVKAFLDEL